MTATEVRAVVLAYHRVRELMMKAEFPNSRHLAEYMLLTEEACYVIAGTSAPSRWTRDIVGSVLAAGMGAATYMRGEIHSPGGALRVFGLVGERSLTSREAWKLVLPYVHEPVLSLKILTDIQRQTQIRLSKLPPDPGPLDVLEELTRPRTSAFAVQMSQWLATYFCEHAKEGSPYGTLYLHTLANLEALNESGEMAQIAGPTTVHGRLSREEWTKIIHGRIPKSRLETRAGYITTRQFLVDYWGKWQEKVA